jgi:hypothetical protein
MEDFEGNATESLTPETKPKVWKRNDIFAFIKRTVAETLLKTLNEINNNIKFTMQLESNNNLPYLDCLITRNENCGQLQTSFYRKG